MKTLVQIAASFAALMIAVAVPAATFSEYTSASGGSTSPSWNVSVGAACSISASAGLYNSNPPIGGGGGTVTVTRMGFGQVLYVAYGHSMPGYSSNSLSGQPAGTYTVAHYASAGPAGWCTGYASTTITW